MDDTALTAKPTQSINDVQIQALEKMQLELSKRFDKLEGKIDAMGDKLSELDSDRKLNNVAALAAIGIALLSMILSIIAVIVAILV